MGQENSQRNIQSLTSRPCIASDILKDLVEATGSVFYSYLLNDAPLSYRGDAKTKAATASFE